MAGKGRSSPRVRRSLIGVDVLPSVPTMTISCSRCGSPAAALMSFDYGNSSVWLDDLVEPLERHGYRLCADHADRLTPPQGWTLTDRRTVTRLFAPVHVA